MQHCLKVLWHLCITRQETVMVRLLERNSQVIESTAAHKFADILSNCTPGQARCLYIKATLFIQP